MVMMVCSMSLPIEKTYLNLFSGSMMSMVLSDFQDDPLIAEQTVCSL